MDTTHTGNAFNRAEEHPSKTAAAHDAIERTAQAAHRAIDKAGPATGRFFDTIRRHTANNPLTALGIAVAVGFVLCHIL